MNTERRDAEINLNDGQTSVTTVTTAVPWDAVTAPVVTEPLTGDALAQSLFTPGMTKTGYRTALRAAGFTYTQTENYITQYYVKS